MARGQSGRIVVEVDPALKRDLYHALAGEDLTLKAWFLKRAQEYVAMRAQPELEFGDLQRQSETE